MAAKKNEKKTNGEGEYRPIDLKLPEGEWWRPWEDGEDVIEVRLDKLRRGEFGEYFVASNAEGFVYFINCHAMLEGLKKFMSRTVRIEYKGKDEGRGKNGVHVYEASLVVRAARPQRRAGQTPESETVEE